MGDGMRARGDSLRATIALATAVAILPAAPAAGQSAGSPAPGSPGPAAGLGSPAPAASVAALPPGFQSGTDPAWSLALSPQWWQIADGEDLVTANGASASRLSFRNDPLPGGATFEEDVSLVEARLEKDSGEKLDLTFRRTGIGTVARIMLPFVSGTGDHAVFLFPACEDGMRVLEIVGTFFVSELAGGPDQWDEVAASVNPCSADAVPAIALTPEVQALATQYYTLARDIAGQIDVIAKPIIKGAPPKVWNRVMKQIRALRTDLAEQVEAMAWTPELLPVAQSFIAATRSLVDSEAVFQKAKKVKQIEANLGPWGDVLDAARAAGAELRLELGLSTLPR
jgi:hypothetical protein